MRPLTTSTNEVSPFFSVTDFHRLVYGASRLSRRHVNQASSLHDLLTVEGGTAVNHCPYRDGSISIHIDLEPPYNAD